MELSEEFFEEKREELVKKLEQKGIKDEKVLKAIGSVPREIFVPEEFADKSYEDSALPIDCNQSISQPYTVAYMTSLLKIKEGDKVLEIGTGSGYQAAVLAEAGAEVYSIERIPQLLDHALDKLNSLNYKIESKIDDGTLGWPEEAPFDSIIVTAAAPKAPENLITQLKVNGILVVPVGDKVNQTMHVIQRLPNNSYRDELLDQFKFVPLIGAQGWQE